MEVKVDPQKLKAYAITWIDAATKSGWHDISELGIAECYAIGYLVKDTKEYLSLAVTISDDGGVLGTISIPKAWIKKRKRVKL